MSSSNNPIDELTERPNDKFGRFLYDLAYILAILGGIILVIVILINFVSILSRIIFLNPLVGDFELVEIGSAIAISSFLPLCHLKKGNVIVDFITAKLSKNKINLLDSISSLIFAIVALFFSSRMILGARDMYIYQEETMLLAFPIWLPFLPVIASLEELDEEALITILTQPKNSLTKQFMKLFEMENVELDIREDALKEIENHIDWLTKKPVSYTHLTLPTKRIV